MRLSETSSGSGGQPLGGMYVTKQSCQLFVYNLGWDHPTIFKPLAHPNENRTGLLPWRDPKDPDNLTPWIFPLNQYVRAAGQLRKVSFNSILPENEAYAETPYQHLYRVWQQLVKTPAFQGLEPVLFKGTQKEGAKIPKAKRVGVMQGVLYAHNGKDYTAAPKTNILMILSPSATVGLAGLLTQVDPRTNMSVVGQDLFDNAPPKLMHFLRSDVQVMLPPNWAVVAQPPEVAQQPGVVQFKHHTPRLVSPTPNVNIPTPQMNLQSWRDWDGVIRTLSAGEQVDILASAYDPFIVMRAFERSEFEPMIPSFIKNGTVYSVPDPTLSAPPQQMPQTQQWPQPQQQMPQQAWAQPQQQAQPMQPQVGYPQQGYQVPQPQVQAPAPYAVPAPAAPQQWTAPLPPQTPSTPPFNMATVMGGNEGGDEESMPTLGPTQPMPQMAQQPTVQTVAPSSVINAAQYAEIDAKLKALNEAKARMTGNSVR